MFHRLTREDLSHIVDLQVELLRRRLATRRLSLDLAPPPATGWRSTATTRRTAPAR